MQADILGLLTWPAGKQTVHRRKEPTFSGRSANGVAVGVLSLSLWQPDEMAAR